MHPEDKMTFSEIRKYLRLMQKRYKLASNLIVRLFLARKTRLS